MAKIIPCIAIEGKKLFRSRIPLISLSVLTLVPFVGGFFMFVLKDPSLGERLGLISAKAQIMGTANWASYLSLLAQAIAIGGLFAFGFITSWIFGREYSDRTIKDLLAVPVPRDTLVSAKFLVTIFWSLALAIFVLILGLIVGLVVDIPGMSQGVLVHGIRVYTVSSILTILLSTPVGFVASYGRGYLSPLGFIVITLILAQVVTVIGYGEYFPWAIPALISTSITNRDLVLSKASVLIVLVTSGLGLLATIVWWKYADHH